MAKKLCHCTTALHNFKDRSDLRVFSNGCPIWCGRARLNAASGDAHVAMASQEQGFECRLGRFQGAIVILRVDMSGSLYEFYTSKYFLSFGSFPFSYFALSPLLFVILFISLFFCSSICISLVLSLLQSFRPIFLFSSVSCFFSSLFLFLFL